jgi:MFS family permease
VLRNRIAVNLAFFINGFVYANWVSRLPRIQELYDADDRKIGFVLLASALGAVFAMPFTGWVIIKNGSRKITLFSLILYCVFVPLIPFMPGYFALLILYFCMGAITGTLDVAMNAQAVLVEQQYKRPIMTSFHAFFSIGMALGAWCGALFADLSYGVFTHFIAISLLSLIAAIWVRYNLVHDRPTVAGTSDGPLFRLPTPALAGVGIIAFCCMIGEGSMADWSVNYMENIAHSSLALAPIALSAFATAMTIGRIFGDWARERVGDGKLIVAGGVTSTLGLATLLLLPTEYVVIGGCFLIGIGLSTIVPITYSIAGNTKELPSGVGIAMVTTVGYTGFLLGPPVIGFVSEWKDLRFGLAIVAILFLIMTVLGIFLARRTTKV